MTKFGEFCQYVPQGKWRKELNLCLMWEDFNEIFKYNIYHKYYYAPKCEIFTQTIIKF
jgi:hypothetical protein